MVLLIYLILLQISRLGKCSNGFLLVTSNYVTYRTLFFVSRCRKLIKSKWPAVMKSNSQETFIKCATSKTVAIFNYSLRSKYTSAVYYVHTLVM